MTSTVEQWRKVADFDRYEVSDLGRVRRQGRLLKPFLTHDGYPVVKLWADNKRRAMYVHVLVAIAFLGPREDWHITQIDHVDGRKINAAASNLEYVSASENHRRSAAMGLGHVGKKNGMCRLSAEDVVSIRDSPLSAKETAAQFNISQSHVYTIRNGRCWKHLAA